MPARNLQCNFRSGKLLLDGSLDGLALQLDTSADKLAVIEGSSSIRHCTLLPSTTNQIQFAPFARAGEMARVTARIKAAHSKAANHSARHWPYVPLTSHGRRLRESELKVLAEQPSDLIRRPSDRQIGDR